MNEIKTVGDLILILKSLPQESLVLVQGYEGDFSEIGNIKVENEQLNYYNEEWNGPHEIVDKSHDHAVIIFRKSS